MAGGLDRRTPKSLKEAQAFRAVQVGSAAGVGFVVTEVLAIAGVLGEGLPVILLLVTVVCALRFAMVTGYRRRR
jgi:hypothetical protein